MTNEVKVLSDDALREIEVRAKKYKNYADRAATPGDEKVVRWFAKTVNALCQTVRVLRAEHKAEHEAHMVTIENLQETLAKHDALREQLAHWQERTGERTSEVERLEAQLAQVTQERDSLRDEITSKQDLDWKRSRP